MLNNSLRRLYISPLVYKHIQRISPHQRLYVRRIPLRREYSTAATPLQVPEDRAATPESLAKYLEELNNIGKFQDTIEIVESSQYNINSSGISHYLAALAAEKKIIIGDPKKEPPLGQTQQTPLYVKQVPQAGQWINFLFWGGLFVLIGYQIYSNTPFQALFSGHDKKFDTLGRNRVLLSHVKGNDEAKEELRDVIEYLKNPGKYDRQDVELPRGILLVGPPGTGKTLLARALAGEAGVPFLFTSGSEFEEMLVGVGANRVRSLFKRAREQAPCIVFIDEIDAVGSRREGPDNKTKMTLNQLLVELDGFSRSQGIIVLAATNLPETLDKALVRAGRFDRQVQLDLPDKKARKEIFELYLKKKAGPDVDLDLLARTTVGLSGADISKIVNWAAIEAVKQDVPLINMNMLEVAQENSLMGRKRSVILTDSTRRLCAFHEAGHALVGLYSPGANTIQKATLTPRGQALGMVSHLPPDDLLFTREQISANMDVAMGGRAAEELIFGPNHVTQGAGSDFQQATAKAVMMVTKLGMSEKVGKVFFSDQDLAEVSQDTKKLIDEEVRAFSEASYVRALKLLKSKKTELYLLAEALLEHETLTLDEIKQVVKGEKLVSKTVKEIDQENKEAIVVDSQPQIQEARS